MASARLAVPRQTNTVQDSRQRVQIKRFPFFLFVFPGVRFAFRMLNVDLVGSILSSPLKREVCRRQMVPDEFFLIHQVLDEEE